MTNTKRNDTYDKITFTPSIELTGASASFKMESRKGELLVHNAATINGDVLEYQLGVGDTAVPGYHNAEFSVVFPDGREKTYPENGYIQVNVTKDIDTNRGIKAQERIVAKVTLIEDFKNAISEDNEQFKAVVTEELNALDQLKAETSLVKSETLTAKVYAETQGDYAKNQGDITKQRTEELNGVNAVQFHERQNTFDTQLAQTMKFDMQSDFVSQISRLIGGYEKMYYKRENSLNWVTVMLRSGNNHVSWSFRTNSHDDFIILGDCFYGDITSTLAIHQNKNYDTLTGSWVTAAPNSHYTTQVGATFTTEVTGEKIIFHHFADNRGGVWEFVINGDVGNKVTVSTFRTTAGGVDVTLKENLPYGIHTVIGTFKGDDLSNAPSSGVGTSRGWVNFSTTNDYRTFRTQKTQLTNNRIQDLLVGFSNKEFAFRTRKAGTSHTYQFIPMHSSIGTAFKKTDPKFIADDKVIDYMSLPTSEFFECNKFSLIQSVYGRNTESGNENLVEINTVVTINKNGDVEIAGKMQPLVDIQIENGYGIMFPVRKEITTKCLTSIGNEYPTIKTDYSSTFMNDELDRAVSFMFISSENPDYVATINFNDPKNTLRTDVDKGANPLWIEHRDTNMQKLYYRPFYNKTLTPLDMFKFSATFNCGKVNGIYNIV